MPTAAKAQVIDQTKEKFEQATGVFLTEYRGLTVQDMQNLRASLREKGGELKVIKNTLFRKALGETADALTEELGSGPTAFAFVYENETDCAKILVDYTKTNKAFVVKGGMLNGKIMDAQAVENFSKLPARSTHCYGHWRRGRSAQHAGRYGRSDLRPTHSGDWCCGRQGG